MTPINLCKLHTVGLFFKRCHRYSASWFDHRLTILLGILSFLKKIFWHYLLALLNCWHLLRFSSKIKICSLQRNKFSFRVILIYQGGEPFQELQLLPEHPSPEVILLSKFHMTTYSGGMIAGHGSVALKNNLAFNDSEFRRPLLFHLFNVVIQWWGILLTAKGLLWLLLVWAGSLAFFLWICFSLRVFTPFYHLFYLLETMRL